MADRLPAISVVLPTYNRRALLSRAVRSVLEQSWTDFELIVVDDASTDNTAALVETWTDPRIRFLRLPQNRGAGGARNAGVAEARAPLIAFQDSDDTWRGDFLERMHTALAGAGPEVGVAYCACLRREDTREVQLPPPWVRPREGVLTESLLRGNFVLLQCSLMRRARLEEVGGFDESLAAFEDWDLILQLSRRCRFRFVDEPMVRSVTGTDSLSVNVPVFAAMFRRFLDKNAALYATRPAVHARLLSNLGDRLVIWGHAGEGRDCFRQAFRVEPSHLGHLFAAAAAFAPPLYRRLSRVRHALREWRWGGT